MTRPRSSGPQRAGPRIPSNGTHEEGLRQEGKNFEGTGAYGGFEGIHEAIARCVAWTLAEPF